ncbi:hypothetical protein [Sphingomonas melonis]|uniref:hypothetical protein n=1 Tax=Sphingomonas melonis TaxID=152682 RepID=UPI0012E73C62|nr:hypothetical protein [Sphingomonas melonis]
MREERAVRIAWSTAPHNRSDHFPWLVILHVYGVADPWNRFGGNLTDPIALLNLYLYHAILRSWNAGDGADCRVVQAGLRAALFG